jgi:hypothetical protein
MGARSGIAALAACALAACALAACSFSPPAPASGVDAPPGTPDAPPVLPDGMLTPDGPPAADCPGDYQMITGLTSRYRLTSTGMFLERHEDCKDDEAGRTHLVVLDSAMESVQLRMSFNQEWWVGAVQARSQPSPGAGWRQITGGTLPGGMWSPGQPNDDEGFESNEQNVGLRRPNGLEDAPTTESYPGLCECDGKEVDEDVEDDIPGIGS